MALMGEFSLKINMIYALLAYMNYIRFLQCNKLWTWKSKNWHFGTTIS